MVTHEKILKPRQYFFWYWEFDLQDVRHLLLVLIWDLQSWMVSKYKHRQAELKIECRED